MDGFNKAMKEQKEKAMASWKGSGEKLVSPFFNNFIKTEKPTLFLGYENTVAEGQILAILKDSKPVDSASEGETIELLLNQTPFYGESGGQIGDSGTAWNEAAHLFIDNSTKPIPELIVHQAKITKGKIKISDSLSLKVDSEFRSEIAL